MSTPQPIKRKPLAFLSPQETGVLRPVTSTPTLRPTTSSGNLSTTALAPASAPTLRPTTSGGKAYPSPSYTTPYSAPPPIPSPTPSTTRLRPHLQTTTSTPNLRTHKSNPNIRNCPSAPPRSATSHPNSPTTASQGNALQKAYGEVSHFLGGLISHPTESTRHYTILRHSHGIVFYRGSTTSIAISTFSDTPLPPDRSYWLQSRGWTGKTGMKAKALLRLTDDWLDVTPSFALRKGQVDTADERAWQRDIGKFRKKAPSKLLSHKLRETIVARIPVEAGDGYFQLNLCQRGKKKVLCSSPVFRVLSTSLDPSSLRGASLTTMPLEVGAMVLGMYAQTAAQAVLNPATAKITNRLDAIKPGLAKQAAAEKAFSLSGMQERLARNGNNDQGNRQEYQQAASLEEGPQHPFPMDFKARIQAPATSDCDPLEISRYTLIKVPDIVLDKLRGYYLAWARFDLPSNTPPKSPTHLANPPYEPAYNPQPSPYYSQNPQTPYHHHHPRSAISPDQPNPTAHPTTHRPNQPRKTPWYPTILTINPLNPTTQTNLTLTRALTTPKTTTLRFITDPLIPPIPQPKLQIRVMCFLRPDIPLPAPIAMAERDLLAAREATAEAEILADACDASYAEVLLGHPAWGPDVSLGDERQGGWVDRTRGGVEGAWMRGEKMIERVPLHWIGVRSATAGVRDREVEVNGFYIVR